MNTNLGTMKKIKNHQLSFCRNWCGQILCQSPECSEDFFFFNHRTWSLYASWSAWSWSTIRSQTAIAEDIFLQLKSIQMMTSFPVLSTLTTLKEKVVLLPGHFWSLMFLHIVVYIYMWNRLKWTILCRICSDYHWIQQICKASLMKQKTSRPNFKKKTEKEARYRE